MAKVDPAGPHASIADTGAGYEITIPAKKNIFVILFLGFWMVGWAVGLVSVSNQLLGGTKESGSSLFLLAWLGAWLVGGGWALATLVWLLVGREIVRVTVTELQHIRSYGLFSRKREYQLAHVKRLRVSPPQNAAAAQYSAGMTNHGAVSFDYGMSTPSFGYALDEAEARAIVDLLTKRFRNLADAKA